MSKLTTTSKGKSGFTPAPSFTPTASSLLQRKCACGGAPALDGKCSTCRSKQLTGQHRPLIQAKLTIGQPNDKYEQEADRVANVVMRMPDPTVHRVADVEEDKKEEIKTKPLSSLIKPLVQRQVELYAENPKDYEEFKIRPKLIDGRSIPQIQRIPSDELNDEEKIREKPLQTKEQSSSTPAVSPNIESGIQSLQGGGQPLSKSSRAFFEPCFRQDFSKVRVHTDVKANQLARSVNASAFTVGKDVVFDAGEYQPQVKEHKRLLAHELVHVLQQTRSKSAKKLPHILQLQNRRVPLLDGGGPKYATKKWGLKVLVSAGTITGSPGANPSGLLMYGKLKNMRTKEEVNLFFIAIGVGIGLFTPMATPHGDWAQFTAKGSADFRDFDGIAFNYFTASLGLGGGYTVMILDFPSLRVEGVNVSGLGYAGTGAEIEGGSGKVNISEREIKVIEQSRRNREPHWA